MKNSNEQDAIVNLFDVGISASENLALAANLLPEIPVFEVKAEGDFLYSVPGIDGKHTRGCYLVFTCPKCKTTNCHGGTYGKKGDGDGYRVSHCRCWPHGYYLKEV